VFWLLNLKIRRGRKVKTQVHSVNSSSLTSNCQCSLFSKKNPIIRIFCISEWLATTINPDKWSSTVMYCYPPAGILVWSQSCHPIIPYQWHRPDQAGWHNINSGYTCIREVLGLSLGEDTGYTFTAPYPLPLTCCQIAVYHSSKHLVLCRPILIETLINYEWEWTDSDVGLPVWCK